LVRDHLVFREALLPAVYQCDIWTAWYIFHDFHRLSTGQ